MTELDQTASVHPRTVTQVSTDELQPVPRSRRARRRTAHGVTWSLTVNELAWQKALELCEGSPGRLEVIDERTVLVHNDSDWRRA